MLVVLRMADRKSLSEAYCALLLDREDGVAPGADEGVGADSKADVGDVDVAVAVARPAVMVSVEVS